MRGPLAECRIVHPRAHRALPHRDRKRRVALVQSHARVVALSTGEQGDHDAGRRYVDAGPQPTSARRVVHRDARHRQQKDLPVALCRAVVVVQLPVERGAVAADSAGAADHETVAYYASRMPSLHPHFRRALSSRPTTTPNGHAGSINLRTRRRISAAHLSQGHVVAAATREREPAHVSPGPVVNAAPSAAVSRPIPQPGYGCGTTCATVKPASWPAASSLA